MERSDEIVIVPATPDRFEGVGVLLDAGAERGCWCQAWRGTDAEGRARGETRPDTLRRQMAGSPPPGFLAYLGEEPVGWVGVAVRTETPRLMNSRTIPLIDDAAVWSIGCFRIRPGYRRRRIATALLAGVVDAARAAGAPGVEAYPIDPAGSRVDAGFAFTGLASMFDAAGFRRVLVTDATSARLPRLLVRLDLSPGQAAPSGS